MTPLHEPPGSTTTDDEQRKFFVAAFFATLIGFSLIWHIWWLAIVGFIGAYATFVVFAWRDESEYEISAEEVERIDRAGRADRPPAEREQAAHREQLA